MSIERFHPIGTPGVPWGTAERAAWLESQTRRRSHADEVDAVILALADRYVAAAQSERHARLRLAQSRRRPS